MNLAMEWEHRLQMLGGKNHPAVFLRLVDAYKAADILRLQGERVVAVLSTPKQVVTTCAGGEC